MSHNVVYQTERADLLGLAELSLLAVRKTGRAMVFRAVDYMESELDELGRNALSPNGSAVRGMRNPAYAGFLRSAGRG